MGYSQVDVLYNITFHGRRLCILQQVDASNQTVQIRFDVRHF